MKYSLIALALFLTGCYEYKPMMTPDIREELALDSCISAFSFSSKEGRKAITIEQHKYCVEHAKQKRIEQEGASQ